MMNTCCSGIGFGTKNFNDKFNYDIEKTKKGIKIHIMPKDESKVEPFQKFVDSCQEFCDCDCGC